MYGNFINGDIMKITTDQVNAYTNEIRNAKCIFIHGTDAFQRDRCFKQIINMLNVPVNDGLQTYLFYGDDYSIKGKAGSILDTLNMFSFDLAERIVSIRYFEQIYKEDITRIAQYCESPSENTKLIMVSDKVDSRITAFKTIISKSLTIETSEIRFDNDLKKWLNTILGEFRFKIDEQTKKYLVENIEIDTFTVYNELKKLEIYIGNRDYVSINDIKDCIANSKTYTVFDLRKAIGLKQKTEALKIAENLINNEESVIMINSILTSFFIQLWEFQLLSQKGLTLYDTLIKAEIMYEKTHDFRKKILLEEYQKYLYNFNLSKIQHALKQLYICDSRAKLSMAPEMTLLTSLVMGIC
jgi:DNA polymerase-3 subunit delta